MTSDAKRIVEKLSRYIKEKKEALKTSAMDIGVDKLAGIQGTYLAYVQIEAAFEDIVEKVKKEED